MKEIIQAQSGTYGRVQVSTTYLLEIPELLEVVFAWDYKIRKIFKPEDPWLAPFSPLTLDFDPDYQSIGKHRSDRARKDLKEWLNKAKLPYHSPHKFRHGHAVYSLKRAKTITDLKAVSQNLNHARIKTTNQIYSILSDNDVKERVTGFSNSNPKDLRNIEEDKIQRIWKIFNE